MRTVILTHNDITATIATDALRAAKQAPKSVVATSSTAYVRIVGITVITIITRIAHLYIIPLVYLRKTSYYTICKPPFAMFAKGGILFYSHSIVPQGFGVKS